MGEQLISSEYHGTPITETFEKQLSRLYGLEEKYSVHNNDGGLKALKRAIDEIENIYNHVFKIITKESKM